MLSVQRWNSNKLCGFSPLQTQFPTCLFARVSIQHDKLEEHSSPRSLGDGLIGLLHLAPEGWKKKMHAGYLGFERDGGGGAAWFWQRGVWCQGLLCVPLFVWACQSVCRVPSTTHPLSDWQTPAIPKPPCEHDSDSRGPDLSLWISLLFPWWTKGAWNSGFGFFLYLFPSGHIRCFQFEAGCGGINSGCASCCRVATGRQHHSNTCGCHLNLLSSITMFSFLKPLQ